MTTLLLPIDRERVPGTQFDDLDLALVESTMRNGTELGRYKGPLDARTYLMRFGGIVQDGAMLYPTVAGVLAFTHEPERWLTASGIDIALYRSDQTLPTRSSVEQVRGPIFQVIDEAVTILQEECTVGRLDGARLVKELDTPLVVLRELTTNAVVHRDLGLFGSQVRIQIFPRFIEWSSPGGLPKDITIETLLTAQFSRNPSLAQFLFHAGYIEKFGMGLDSVIDALLQARLGTPEFHDDGHSFRVRVQRRVEQADEKPDLTTKEGRAAAILDLFTIRGTWHQHEILRHLAITRSTLQRDLDLLVKQQRLIARGATKNRVYTLPKPDRDR